MQRLGGFLITKFKQLQSRTLAQCISEQGIDAFSGEQGKILFVLWQKDKRKSLVILTEHANSLKKCSDKISDEMLKKMYRGFSEEEIDKFEEYLHRIIKNFEERRKVISDDKSINKIINRRF